MYRCLVLFLACLLLWVNTAQADDSEAFLPAGSGGGVFVHVVMDLGDSERDVVLCTYGVDCGPPFMTEAAYRHLGDMYTTGQPVTAPGVFKAVLAAVLENSQFDDVHVALMISNHQDNRPGTLDSAMGGGTLLQGYRRLLEHRGEFIATLKSTPILASAKSHELQPKESYFEWLRYIQGGHVLLGDNTRGNFGLPDPAPNYDATIIRNGKYLTPFTDRQACQQLYSILFTLGSSEHDGDLDTQIAAQLPVSTPLSFQQLLDYLHNTSTNLLPDLDVNVSLQKTWVVTSRDRAGSAAEYADAGGGGPPLYVNDPTALQASLTRALAQVSASAGSSLEMAFAEDVFHPGEVLDNLYLPLFLPQGNVSWPGNVKKLRFKDTRGTDHSAAASGEDTFDWVFDARDQPAFELAGLVGRDRGRLRFDALTFWTDVASLPPGDGETIPNGADGPFVTRGGAGQKIDGFAHYSAGEGKVSQHFIGDTNADAAVNGYPPRQLYYEPEAGQDFVPFDADAKTLLGIRELLDPAGELTNEALLDLIRWGRGQDTRNGKSSARGWIMGAVMHSRPVALNYGATPGYSKTNPNVRLMFGSADGIFHILQDTDTNGAESGREVFGFYPRELLANIRWLYEGATTPLPRYYGADGAPVALKVDNNADGTIDYRAGDKAYVYFGLRRGGFSYFALDVSNPDTAPRLLWKIAPADGGAFEELGLTFSTPVVGKVNYNGRPQDVLVFTGGYNGGWDQAYTARRGKDLAADDDARGNAIYIVDALTGELIWKAIRGTTGSSSNTSYAHAGLVDSIPSPVAALVTPAGIVHRLYVGDSGGAVWRVDLPENPGSDVNHRRDHWFITKLADLGFDAGEPGGAASADRRFFHAPDIVHSYDMAGDFDGVLIQSGNGENPHETQVENAIFYLKDRQVTSGATAVKAENSVGNPAGRFQFNDLPDQSVCIEGSEETGPGEGGLACGERNLQSGWKVRFLTPGEKGLSTPLTDGGRVFASTFVPGTAVPGSVAACSAQPGHGRLHVLRLDNATAAANGQRDYELGPGIPAGVTSIGDSIFLPDGVDLYDLDGDGVRDTVQVLPSKAAKLYRTYWREPGVDPL
jgi:type IV pilus assembly protein PilY1